MGYLRTRNLGRTLNAWISCSWNIANQSATPDYLYLTQSIRSIELCGSQMIRQIDCIWTPSRLPLLGFGPHRWRKNEANLKEVEWRFCVWILKRGALASLCFSSWPFFICPAAFRFWSSWMDERVSVFFLSRPLSRNSAHFLVSSFGWFSKLSGFSFSRSFLFALSFAECARGLLLSLLLLKENEVSAFDAFLLWNEFRFVNTLEKSEHLTLSFFLLK